MAHECEQPSGLYSVGADIFVYFYLILFDEVEGVIAADGEEMGYFGFVFASTDVEDKFFFGEDVGVVERTAGFLLFGNYLEHAIIIIRTYPVICSWMMITYLTLYTLHEQYFRRYFTHCLPLPLTQTQLPHQHHRQPRLQRTSTRSTHSRLQRHDTLNRPSTERRPRIQYFHVQFRSP